MLSRNILHYGKEAPLPERITLRAGPLDLMYDQGDLRSICLGDQEILRRVYVAVRDRNWGTIAPVFSNVELRVDSDRFAIAYDVENRAGKIDFAWHGEIRGEADGTLTFEMEGTARSTFYKNRIGFCVLYPAGLSGRSAEVEHTDGRREQAPFPVDICADQPVQPFANLRDIRHPVRPGVVAEVCFRGDIFEMEDQRLWTDASYKIFCPPLSLPYPVEIQAGTRIEQSVRLKLIGRRPLVKRETMSIPGGLRRGAGASLLIKAPRDWRPAPPIGLSVASHGEPLSARELNRLRALHLHHLRVELRLSEPEYPDRLKEAMDEAGSLGIPLEVALAVSSSEPEGQLSELRDWMAELRPAVCAWLVFPEHEPYTGGNPSEEIARLANRILKPNAPSVPLAVGTNTDFIFLKRTRLPLQWMDQVCITLNPQVHAFDLQSMVETLEVQPVVIESARRMAQGRPVRVSPITFRPRFNPYATGPQAQSTPGELPPQVDVRQASLFGAGWTLGSLRAMVAGGSESVTYYETTGWLGVMESEKGSPLPHLFPSVAGSVFPLYHVLADYGEFAGGQACALSAASPLLVSALALKRGEHTRYILANHTAESLTIELETDGETLDVWSLDATNAESGMRDPEGYRQKAGVPTRTQNGVALFHLQPYGLIRADHHPVRSTHFLPGFSRDAGVSS